MSESIGFRSAAQIMAKKLPDIPVEFLQGLSGLPRGVTQELLQSR